MGYFRKSLMLKMIRVNNRERYSYYLHKHKYCSVCVHISNVFLTLCSVYVDLVDCGPFFSPTALSRTN